MSQNSCWFQQYKAQIFPLRSYWARTVLLCVPGFFQCKKGVGSSAVIFILAMLQNGCRAAGAKVTAAVPERFWPLALAWSCLTVPYLYCACHRGYTTTGGTTQCNDNGTKSSLWKIGKSSYMLGKSLPPPVVSVLAKRLRNVWVVDLKSVSNNILKKRVFRNVHGGSGHFAVR
jgi:hypothetical protein